MLDRDRGLDGLHESGKGRGIVLVRATLRPEEKELLLEEFLGRSKGQPQIAVLPEIGQSRQTRQGEREHGDCHGLEARTAKVVCLKICHDRYQETKQ